MTISEYLLLFKELRIKPQIPNFEKQIVISPFIAKGIPINFIPICSSSVFPEIVNIMDKDYIIWDSTFWEFFKAQAELMYAIGLSINTKNELNQKPSYFAPFGVSMKKNFLLYLSYRMGGYNSIAHILSQYFFEMRHPMKPAVRFLATNLEICETYIKHFVSEHEANHILFSKKPDFYKEYSKNTIECINFVLNNKMFYNDLPEKEVELFEGAIQNVLSSNYELEELCCDLGAFESTVKAVEIITKQPLETIFSVLIESTYLFRILLSNLYIVDKVWQDAICFPEKIEYISSSKNLVNVYIRNRLFQCIVRVFMYMKYKKDYFNVPLTCNKHVQVDYEFTQPIINELCNAKFIREVFSKSQKNFNAKKVDILRKALLKEKFKPWEGYNYL